MLKVTKFGSSRPADMVKHYQPSNLYYNPRSNLNHKDVEYLHEETEIKILGSGKIRIGHKNLEKVITSRDESRLYVGGSGLHMLKYSKSERPTSPIGAFEFNRDIYGSYNPVEVDEYEQTQLFALRPTNSGHVVI